MASTPTQLKPASHAEITSQLQKYLHHWQAPKQVLTLEKSLSKTFYQNHSNDTLTHCVCIGIGAFQHGRSWSTNFPSDIEPELASWINSALEQMAFLVTLLQLLRKRHAIQEVYIQDPDYNEVEVSFLQDHLGFTVLETPNAFDKVTASTFLFAPRVHMAVTAEALERAHPALYIGNDIEVDMRYLREEGEGIGYGKPGSTVSGVPILETLGRFREEVDRRQMRAGENMMDWCQVTFIYWRRREREGGVPETQEERSMAVE